MVCSTVAIETRPSLSVPATVADAGPVFDVEGDLVTRGDVADRDDRQVARVDSPTPTPPAMCRRAANDVTENGGSGLHSPGARAVEHEIPVLPPDQHCVVRAWTLASGCSRGMSAG